MRIVRIHIATVLLILGLCETAISVSAEAEESNVQKATSEDETEFAPLHENHDSTSEDDVLQDEQSDDLPILPPIILLDFDNDTDDGNSTSEDKSKRTVNNGLGYGFDRNSLHQGKHNYYFPGGKTGTTVSIEESISPFLPKTIIEKIHPNSYKSGGARAIDASAYQNLFNSAKAEALVQSQSHTNFQYSSSTQASKPQSVFGLRTKLHKAPTSTNFESYQNFLFTPRPSAISYNRQNSGYRGSVVSSTTPSSLEFSPTEQTKYVTSNPLNYGGSRQNNFGFALPNSFAQQSFDATAQAYTNHRQNVQSNSNSQLFEQTVESSTVSPMSYNSQTPRPPTQFSNTPRYTIENGIRYENKIFWKYPDGRVSDVPPATYVETSYSEFPQSSEPQASRTQQSPFSSKPASMENGIYSQGPVQFPTVAESSRQEPSPFISSESVSSSLPQQQVYRLGYQNLLTQKQNSNLAQQTKATSDAASLYSFPSVSSSPSASPPSLPSRTRSKPRTQTQRFSFNSQSYLQPQALSRYEVNSPNPEYTDAYTTEPTVKSTTPTNLFTPSAGAERKKENSGAKVSGYSNVQYSDLLNYNPSISQYVRNPSSILNVQPTFVQAGNSLIPVIILRVDGSPPTQSKATPNINLKALLQQYLIQYANSIQELARPSSYEFGAGATSKSQPSIPNGNALLDLIRFTQNDARNLPAYAPDPYNGRPSYETTSFDTAHGFFNGRHGGRQKVKSVQILEDSPDTRIETGHYKNAS